MAVPPNPSPTSDHKGKLNIPELKDAELAGDAANSQDCTLILTVGDSVKAFVMSVLSRVGHDKYGVFPLKGNLLNVRGASSKGLLEDPKIQNIKDILGLQYGKSYENAKELRYGHLLIMADQDHDGPHFIGQMINFLHYFCPSLLKVDKFMRVFKKPALYAPSKTKSTTKVLSFYSIPEYEEWEKISGNKAREYKPKYYSYKRLESIKSERTKCYFADLEEHIKDFVWVNDEDGYAIGYAFEARNRWLKAPQADTTYFDSKDKCIRYLDFINKEFKQYVAADLQRSIPSMLDGMKPSQRKILFCAFKKPIIQKTLVDQFSYYVERTAYPHSEESRLFRKILVGTIIGMAQNYVGSNNINLFQPNDGQFGTRLMGGKDHDASGRSLFTQLSPITRYLFHKDDELILNYLNDNGQSIEPEWFIPIIPMVLVNGSEGKGTEFSSFIPNYNPRDIIANLKRLLKCEAMVPMLPWYREFKGDIKKTASKRYTTKGIITKAMDALSITELPVGMWTEDYKEILEAASQDGKDIKAYTARNDTTNVHFEITMTEDQMNRVGEKGLLKKFKLTTTLSTANMHLLDANGEVKKYDTHEQILEDFFHLRLDLYEKRRISLIRELQIASCLLENKAKFIGKVCDGDIILFPSKKRDERAVELKKKGFQSLQSIERAVDHVDETEEEEPGSYDYLMSPFDIFYSCTYKKMEELKQESDAKKNKFQELILTGSRSLWLKDLNDLDCQLDAENYPLAEQKAPAKRARDAARPQWGNKKRCIVASDSDEEEPEDDNDATEDSDFEDEE